MLGKVLFKIKVNLLVFFIIVSFFLCSKKFDTVQEEKNVKKFTIGNQRLDSLKIWNERALRQLLIQDSIFIDNECPNNSDTINCNYVRGIVDSLNKLDKWFIDRWESKIAGRSILPSKLVSEGVDEGIATIYKEKLLKAGFSAKWDFDFKGSSGFLMGTHHMLC